MSKILTNYNNLDNKEKKEYEQSMKKLYIIMIVATLIFYVIPFALLFTGEFVKVFLPMMLFLINPLFAYMACLLHSRKHDFSLLIPAALGIFFLPTALIIYKDYRFAMFSIIYFVLGLFGEITGHLFLMRKKSKRQPIGLNRLVNGSNKKNKNAKQKKKTKNK